MLFTFWVLLVFASIPRFRFEINHFDDEHFGNDGLSWEGFQFIYYMSFFSLICVMLILNLFTDKPPQNSTFPKDSNPNPELSASMFNRVFFFFFEPTAWSGWRRPLTEKDIFDINPENTSRELVPRFDKNFQRNVDKNKRSVRGRDNKISIN